MNKDELIQHLKDLFTLVGECGDCNCDEGGPGESVHICEKHRAQRDIQALIYENGGGLYE